MTDAKLVGFAERFIALSEAFKSDKETIAEQAKQADLDVPALRRLASWMGKDDAARAAQEALDDQYRFLAGLLPTPAELPPESELATAAALYADKLSVRDVAKQMGISVGKAHKLKTQAAAFTVHVNVNAPRGTGKGIGHNSRRACISPCAATWQQITSSRDAFEAEREAAREAERVRRRAEHAKAAARNAEIDADPLTIPPFLQRVA